MTAVALSTQALKNLVLKKCGELQDGTSPYETDGTVLDYLDRAHVNCLAGGSEFDVDIGDPWSWAVKSHPGVLNLVPNYNTGSCTFTQDSTSLTLSTIPKDRNNANISLVGYFIQAANDGDWYRISAHTSGTTSATLDAAFTSTTATSSSFNAVKLEYAITAGNGILRLCHALNLYALQDAQGDNEGKVDFMDHSALMREYPLHRLQAGTPTRFSIVNQDSSGTFTIRLNLYVESPIRVEYDYIEIPDKLVDSTSNFPLVPVQFVEALVFMASAWLCTDKTDDRGDKYFAISKNKLNAMYTADRKQKKQMSKNRGRVIPRLDNFSRRPWYVRGP